MKAQMYNYSTWIEETDPNKLKTGFQDLLTYSGFGILGFTDWHFTPQGYTCLFLLSESHLAIHTFPEHKQTYLELSSCVKEQFDKFVKLV